MPAISRRNLIAAAAAVALPAVAAAQTPRFDPTSRYVERRILGWAALVHKGFEQDHGALSAEVLRLLEFQLYQVTRVIPKPALEKLKRVRIWVEHNEGHHPCMAYHPSASWLREHDMNPDKAKCVEIAGAESFLSWTLQQPWMVLHEMAHAYHDQVLSFNHPELRAAHQAAVKSGKYDRVLRWSGESAKHYALNDPMEYFAEATEAYFGTNDFYPFVRPELKQHDPEGYHLVEKLWRVRG